MKSTCAPDNIHCLATKLLSDPAATLQSLDMITLGVLWCGIALFGAYLITRN